MKVELCYRGLKLNFVTKKSELRKCFDTKIGFHFKNHYVLWFILKNHKAGKFHFHFATIPTTWCIKKYLKKNKFYAFSMLFKDQKARILHFWKYFSISIQDLIIGFRCTKIFLINKLYLKNKKKKTFGPGGLRELWRNIIIHYDNKGNFTLAAKIDVFTNWSGALTTISYELVTISDVPEKIKMYCAF